MKIEGRTILLTLVTILFITTGQALPSETLEKEEPEITLNEDHIHIETSTILEKQITFEQLLLPDNYTKNIEYFETNFTSPEDRILTEYQLQEHEDIPEKISGEEIRDTVELQKNNNKLSEMNQYGPDNIAQIEHGYITANIHLHYNKIKIEYIIDENTIEKDIYKGEEPDKLPVNIERNQEKLQLSYDNSLSEPTTKELHVLRYEESEMEEIEVENGEISKQCVSDFDEDTAPQLDESGISSEMMPGHILNHELECLELDIEENTITEATIEFDNPTPVQEVDGDLEVIHENDHYIYVIGSGSATRAFEGYEFCGTYEYDNIIIDGDAQICEEGATLDAEDTIRINGELQGQGQTREQGPDLTLKANYIQQDQVINLEGGEGGAIIPHGGDGGTLTVDATTYYADRIITNGGHGTQEAGGDGGDAGNIQIEANRFKQSSIINATGGLAGSGEDEVGGDGGDGGGINIEVGEATIQNTEILSEGLDGGNGGDGTEDRCEGLDGGDGGDGGGINIEAEILELDDTDLHTSSGDGGNGGEPYDSEQCVGGDGGNAGIPNNIHKGLYLHGGNATYTHNNFYSLGGDGGNAEVQGLPGDAADGGEIVRKWDNEIEQNNNEDFISGGDGGESKETESWDSELSETQVTDLNFDVTIEQDYSYIQQIGFEPDTGGTFEVKIEYYDGDTFAETTVDGEADEWVTAEFERDDYRRLLQETDDIFVSVNLQGDSSSYLVISRTETADIIAPDTANFPAHHESAGGTVLNSTYTGAIGDDGSITEAQETTEFKDTTINIEKESLIIEDRTTADEGFIQQGNNASIEFNFTTEEDSIDEVEVDIYNADEELEENLDMNLQDSYQQNEEYFWSYTQEFDIPQEEDSAGAWLVTPIVHDDLGDRHSRSNEAIYMYTVKQVSETTQEQANLQDPIPITQTLETSNPTLFDYEELELEHELIDTARLQSVNVERLGEEQETHVDSTENTVIWDTDELSSEGLNEWDIIYELEEIQVNEELEEEDEAGQVKTVTKTLTLENPSNEHDITNIVAQPDIPEPEEVVDWSLHFEGEEVTNDPDIDPELVDTTLDGQEDSIEFNIEELETDEQQEWEITSFLGDPITKYSEEVITNHPVQEGKTIDWRIGYAFENNNDFALQHEDKLRVPLEASNTRLEGELKPVRFDEQGAYIEFEDEIPANSNETRFLTFESRSITTTSSLKEQDRLFLEDDTAAALDLNVENLINLELTNIEHPVQLQYGEEVTVVDEEDQIIQEEGTVNQEFTLELDSIEPNEIKDLSVKYDTRTGEKELVREGVTDEGNDLNVYRIESNSNQPLENVWIEIDEIDCVEVEEIRMLGENESTTTSVIDNYRCGSTQIPIGTLLPDQELHIGVEYRATEPRLETDNALTTVIIGAGIFVFYGLIIVGAEAARRRWLT